MAEQGHLTEAAKRLGLAQPTLSRQLQALERELAVRLLVRTPRGMVLSDAGAHFLTHAREALEALRVGTTELDELSHNPRGTVALGTLPTVGAYVMPTLLQAFHRRHPAVRLRLAEGLPERLEDGVASGELDLAVLNLPVRRGELVAQKLWQEDFVLVVPRGHPLGQTRRAVALSTIIKEPVVVIPGAAGAQAIAEACEERGLEPRIAVETDNPESARRMVERGLGIALLPALIARERGRAVEVVEVAGAPRRQVALVHRGERSLSAGARALKRLVVERLQQPDAPPEHKDGAQLTQRKSRPSTQPRGPR